MRRILSIARWGAILAVIGVVIYVVYEPVWAAAKWVAWNWIRVDFIATCRVFEHSIDYDINDFEFVDGPYSGEFLREVARQWEETYPDIALGIEDDGTLTVPLGFYLPVDPFWSKFGGNPEPEERGHSVSAGAAYHIFQRRLAEGLDVTPYQHFAERGWHKRDGPRNLNAPVCGFIDFLIRKDAPLARP